MDFKFNEEQTMLKQMVHDFAEKELRPIANDLEVKAENLPDKYVKQMADLGLLGLCLPTEYGGQGQSTLAAIIAIEELARVSSLCAMPVFECNVGPVKVVEQFGTDKQKGKYLPASCSGEGTISIGMTEPEAGSALTDLQTSAVLKGDHYVVNGMKRFCTGGGASQVYLVYVRLSEQKGPKGIGGLLIEKGTPGFSFGKQEQFMGLRGCPSCDLIFYDCLVPKENLVVKEGEFKKLMWAFDLERCGNSTMCLGIAQGALEEATAYAQQRKQFGKEICEFQAIQLMLADMAIKVEAARLLIYKAAVNSAAGLPAPLEANLAKCFANQMVRDVTGMALQIHGGYGYSKDYPVERMMRDGWGWGIAGGTIDIQRINIASFMLGRRFDQRK